MNHYEYSLKELSGYVSCKEGKIEHAADTTCKTLGIQTAGATTI